MRAKEQQLNQKDIELELNENAIVFQTTLDILAHDSRNLFTNIFALLADLPPDTVSEALNKNVNELYNLISEALGYVSFEKRIFSLVDLIESISMGKKRIDFSYRSRRLFFIETGRVFKNVLSNIIENALKYSEPESKVVIRLRYLDDHIRIMVSDSGIGISDEEKSRIFERSYRAESAKHIQGTGKGLWIVKNIVKKEGGSIAVEDNPGGGTVMIVTIPAFRIRRLADGYHMLEEWYGLSRVDIENKAKVIRGILELEFPDIDQDMDSLVFANLLDRMRTENIQQENGKVWRKLNNYKSKNPKGTSVLLVDDSLYVHYKTAPLLADNGFHIAGYALNGRDAVNQFRALRARILILDITMPVLSGIDAAKKIIEIDPQVKIVFSTALGQDKLVLDELRENFNTANYRVCTKPFHPEELVAAIHAVLKNRSL